MNLVQTWLTSLVKPSSHHPHTKTTFSAVSWVSAWPPFSLGLSHWLSFASTDTVATVTVNWLTNNFVKMESKISSTSSETVVWRKFVKSSIKVVQLAVQRFRQIWETHADVSTPMACPPSAAPTSPCYPRRPPAQTVQDWLRPVTAGTLQQGLPHHLLTIPMKMLRIDKHC